MNQVLYAIILIIFFAIIIIFLVVIIFLLSIIIPFPLMIISSKLRNGLVEYANNKSINLLAMLA